MATVREERAARIRKRVGEGLADNLGHVLPLLLDDLDAIDQAHAVPAIKTATTMTDKEAAEFAEQWMKNFKGGVTAVAPAEPRPPTDAEIGEWTRTHDREFAAWVRKQDRINGTPAPVAPEKPAPRRRTARKDGD